MSDIPKSSAIGIVYAADGWPRISPDWIRALSAPHRAWVEQDLAKRGFRLTPDFNIEELP